MITTAFIKGLMSAVAAQKNKLSLTVYESAFFSNTKHYLFLFFYIFFFFDRPLLLWKLFTNIILYNDTLGWKLIFTEKENIFIVLLIYIILMKTHVRDTFSWKYDLNLSRISDFKFFNIKKLYHVSTFNVTLIQSEKLFYFL